MITEALVLNLYKNYRSGFLSPDDSKLEAIDFYEIYYKSFTLEQLVTDKSHLFSVKSGAPMYKVIINEKNSKRYLDKINNHKIYVTDYGPKHIIYVEAKYVRPYKLNKFDELRLNTYNENLSLYKLFKTFMYPSIEAICAKYKCSINLNEDLLFERSENLNDRSLMCWTYTSNTESLSRVAAKKLCKELNAMYNKCFHVNTRDYVYPHIEFDIQKIVEKFNIKPTVA